MTNQTFHKYCNLFNANRGYNDLFNEWVKEHYNVHTSTDPWSYGRETFTDKTSGKHVLDATIMQMYVKARRPYFKDFGEVDEWLYSDIPQKEFFARRAKR